MERIGGRNRNWVWAFVGGSVAGVGLWAASPPPAEVQQALETLRAGASTLSEVQRAKADGPVRLLLGVPAKELPGERVFEEGAVPEGSLPGVDPGRKPAFPKEKARREEAPQADPLLGFFSWSASPEGPLLSLAVEALPGANLEEVASSLGGRFEGQRGSDRGTVLLPAARLSDLLRHEAVVRVRRPAPAKPYLDAATQDTGAAVVKQDWGFRGEGALYGAIDTGIDWSHGDFKNADGTTRILYLWDQTDPTGPPPSGFTYGTEWTASQINAGSCTETDNDPSTWGHGSSTTGCGAGNGLSTGGTYAGHAERAGILFVKSDLSDAHIEDGLSYLWNKAQGLGKPLSINMSFGGGWGPHDGSDTLSDWIDHTFGASDATAGLHLSAAAENDTGNQQHADGAVCVSANPDNGYASDNTYVVLYSYDWNGNGYAGQPMFLEFYAPASASLEVRAWIPIRYNRGAGWTWTYGTSGWKALNAANSGFYYFTRKTTGCTSQKPCFDSFVGDITSATFSDKIGVLLDLQNPLGDYPNPALQYVFAAYDYATTDESSFGGDLYYDPGTGPRPIILQFRQNGGSGSGAHVDGYLPDWVYGYFAAGTEDCSTRLLSGDDAEMINGPAAAHLVTAVGAHVTKTSWTDRSGTPQSTTETKDDLASYSSHGPLRGLLEGTSPVTDQKPNLTAPGEVVVTTLSGQFAPSWYSSSPQNTYIVQETPADKHIAVSGTSFSCANVAGAATLLLGADPSRTLGQIRADLEQGARSDAFTGKVPNDLWGYGKLTLANSLDRFADLVYRGTVATSLTPLHGGVGGTYTDPGAASGTELYFYSVDVPGDGLRLPKSGSDVVLSW